MKNQYLLKIWLKWLNSFLKITILSWTQLWNIKYLEQLFAPNSSHHMHLYIWTTWWISFSKIQLRIWFRCIDDIFFIWTASEKELDDFLERLNNFHSNIKVTHEPSKEEINFLMLLLELIMVNLSPVSTANPLMAINTFTFSDITLVAQNLQLFLVRLWEREEFLLIKVISLLMLESLRTGSKKETIQRIWSIKKQKWYLKVLH